MSSIVYEPGNRAYYVTADDARAGPCVFAWILSIWSSLTMIARVYARRQKWTWSDWCSCKMHWRWKKDCQQLTEFSVIAYVSGLSSAAAASTETDD